MLARRLNGALLVCGILSSVLYVAMVAVIAMQWESYSSASQTRFRRYSVVTLLILVICGALTFQDAPRLQANLSTPWIGVWERTDVGAFLLWVVVVATVLLRLRSGARCRALGDHRYST